MQGAGAGGAGGGSGGGDSELVSRTLQLEQKLYYLDLKDNTRGRFLKISERTNSNRSTIIVPLNGIVWFVDLFNYYANGDDAELSSKELQLETKVPPSSLPRPIAASCRFVCKLPGRWRRR